MLRYRNKRTGRMIETNGPIVSPDYEKVKDAPAKKPAGKTTARKTK